MSHPQYIDVDRADPWSGKNVFWEVTPERIMHSAVMSHWDVSPNV
jgi:hypothetical protein